MKVADADQSFRGLDAVDRDTAWATGGSVSGGSGSVYRTTDGGLKRCGTTFRTLQSKVLGVDDRFWINIQTDYDLEVERDRHGSELEEIIPLVAS